MSLFKEVIAQALGSVVAHRFRASLTMLGIAWGIVTVVLMMSYGNGFRDALMYGFRNAFSQGVVVIRGGQTSRQAGGERAGRRIFLKQDDVEALRELGYVKSVSPEYLQSLPIGYGIRQTNAGVRGVSPEYGVMRSEVAEHGRFLTAEDCEQRRRVAFLGAEVARKLFSNIPPVGEEIRISGVTFTVVGVMVNKAQISNYFYPDRLSVFIPYSAVTQVWDQDSVSDIVLQTLSPMTHDRAIRQVRDTLAARHRFDARDERAARIQDSVEITGQISGMTDGLRYVLMFIGTLTLMIGGVGVMNIMYVSVTERTREIGVRKALGARRRHILTQFLLEGLTITFMGGVFGLGLSYALVKAIKSRPLLGQLLEDPSGLTDVQLHLAPEVLLTATAILGLAGVISGMLPAIRASRLDPIESLRYE